MALVLHRRTLIAAAAAALANAHFFPDDPLLREPPPLPVGNLPLRTVDDGFNQLMHSFRGGKRTTVRAANVNTIDEVPDGAWYVNRPGGATLRRGEPPALDAPLQVTAAKTEGATPGLEVRDSRNRKYLLKFDPPLNPSMTTAAEVIGAHFFHALGYHVPDNHLAIFSRGQIAVRPGATISDLVGKKRPMREEDIDQLLAAVSRRPDGKYRAVASRFIEGDIIGPWLYHGARSDDPNDVVPHENRRELRGMYVFAAWLNHYDATSINTLDSIVEENGLRFVKHYLIDFGSIMGASAIGARDPQDGFIYQFDLRHMMGQVATAGLHAPDWQRIRYPNLPEVGRFESAVFDPRAWKPIYHNPAFDNRLPDDNFWAAKKLMRFSEARIREIVATGQYENPASEDFIVRTLLERRRKLARAFLGEVLPLDRFRIEAGRVVFDDLAPTRTPISSCRWYTFDNRNGRKTRLPGEDALRLPASGAEYLALEITGTAETRKTWIYVRKGEVVGVRREW